MARLKVLFIALVLLLSFPAIAQEQYGVADSVARARAMEYYYLQAHSYMEQDSIDRCFEMLEHCHALDPSSMAVMYDLSSYYAFFNKDSIAHTMLERIVKADPSNVYYNNALVNYYMKVGNIDAAIRVYERLLETAHSKSEICIYLFSLYSDAGRYEDAIAMLEKLEALEGTNEKIVTSKVRIYMELGDSASAIKAISGMINDYPEELRYTTMLGNVYWSMGDKDKALDAYNKVLSVRPDDVYALSSLVDYYTNDTDDSLYCDAVERLLKSEGLDTDTRLNVLVQYIEYAHPKDSAHLATFMREMTSMPFDESAIANLYTHYLAFVKASPDIAVPALERALSLEPDNLSVIVRLLEYAVERNDADAVFKYADNAQLYCPDKLEVYYYKGMSSYMLGRKHESVEIYKEGIAKCADDTPLELLSTIYALMGDTYHELDMMDCCYQAYDSALVYNANNVSVLNNYAYFLALDSKELNRALEMIQRAIDMNPNDATCIDTYAWVLFKLERYEEAKAYAEKLISLGEELSPEVYHHCGDIYAMCGDMQQAVNYWTVAQKNGDDSKLLAKKIKKRKYYSDAKRNK